MELKTDFAPDETEWTIQNENGDTILTDPGYDENFTIYNQIKCLPVGCYDFIIDDIAEDGICCISDYFDDAYFDDAIWDVFFSYYPDVDDLDGLDGYYKGTVYGTDEIFSGGEFGSRATESFCGEDLCN